MKDPVKKLRRETRVETERQLDEAIEESFPASDPLPTTHTSAAGPDHRSKAKRERRPGGRRE
jgi:hypothetical protein